VEEILAYVDRDHYMGTSETCWYTGISRRNIEQRLDEIPHYRLGRKLLIKKSELDQWLQRYQENPKDLDVQELADEAVAALENGAE